MQSISIKQLLDLKKQYDRILEDYMYLVKQHCTLIELICAENKQVVNDSYMLDGTGISENGDLLN
jgi:hypothetical protein